MIFSHTVSRGNPRRARSGSWQALTARVFSLFRSTRRTCEPKCLLPGGRQPLGSLDEMVTPHLGPFGVLVVALIYLALLAFLVGVGVLAGACWAEVHG